MKGKGKKNEREKKIMNSNVVELNVKVGWKCYKLELEQAFLGSDIVTFH